MRIINKNKLIIILVVLGIAIVSGIFVYINSDKLEEISYLQFMNHLEEGKVDTVYISNNSKLKVLLEDGSEFKTDNPRSVDFKKELLMHEIDVVEESGGFESMFMPLITLGVLTAIILYVMNKGSKQAEKEMTNMSTIEKGKNSLKITFDDVAGNQEAKNSLKELVDFIKKPKVYIDFGARMPRGVLLYGSPGTGKTLLAKALAGEANAEFFAVTGSDFVQVYAGLGASRIRKLFKQAKEAGKAVIFIDEIDAIGKKRATVANGSEEGDRTLNALLAEMSGFDDNEGIIVVAATNRIDILDEALLRPGRFDRQIEVELPDVKARFEILKLHGKNKPMDKDIDLKNLAYETVYFSGAKLENLLNEAAMFAVTNKSTTITKEHIDKAYHKVLVGEEKLDRSHISKLDKEITAYHEAGHALVSKLVDKNNRVTKVSIIPSTKGIGGFSLNIPPERIYSTKKDIINNIMIALGGRVAEELIYGEDNITSGASSDLKRATELVLSMIGNLGMDEYMGLVNYDIIASKNINLDNKLILRSNELLRDIYNDTMNLVENHRKQLEDLASLLLEKESLGEEDIDNILIKGNSLE